MSNSILFEVRWLRIARKKQNSSLLLQMIIDFFFIISAVPFYNVYISSFIFKMGQVLLFKAENYAWKWASCLSLVIIVHLILSCYILIPSPYPDSFHFRIGSSVMFENSELRAKSKLESIIPAGALFASIRLLFSLLIVQLPFMSFFNCTFSYTNFSCKKSWC